MFKHIYSCIFHIPFFPLREILLLLHMWLVAFPSFGGSSSIASSSVTWVFKIPLFTIFSHQHLKTVFLKTKHFPSFFILYSLSPFVTKLLNCLFIAISLFLFNFSHTTSNLGPHSLQKLRQCYRTLKIDPTCPP